MPEQELPKPFPTTEITTQDYFAYAGSGYTMLLCYYETCHIKKVSKGFKHRTYRYDSGGPICKLVGFNDTNYCDGPRRCQSEVLRHRLMYY